MSYITTFNATFFTAMISFIFAEIFFAQLFKAGILFTTNYPRLALVLPGIIGILSVIGWFVWSVEGTVTAAFWGAVMTALFYKPITKRRSKKIMQVFDNMDVKHIKHA